MTKSTSFATLIVASLLSVGRPERSRRCAGASNDSLKVEAADKQEVLLDRLLSRASMALAVTFAVATTLPPSSLALRFDAPETSSSVAPPQDSAADSQEPIGDDGTSSISLDGAGSILPPDVTRIPIAFDDDDAEDDALATATLPALSFVDGNAVKDAWVRRSRSRSRSRNARKHNHIHHHRRHVLEIRHLESIIEREDDEYAAVPEMTPCDSSSSDLSSVSSIGTRSSSQDLLGLSPAGKTRVTKRKAVSWQNAEWAIIE